MQFELIVVTISLKMCVKDLRLLERKDLTIMYRSALASGLLTFWSTLTNWQIIFKPLDVFFFFEKIEILTDATSF